MAPWAQGLLHCAHFLDACGQLVDQPVFEGGLSAGTFFACFARFQIEARIQFSKKFFLAASSEQCEISGERNEKYSSLSGNEHAASFKAA